MKKRSLFNLITVAIQAPAIIIFMVCTLLSLPLFWLDAANAESAPLTITKIIPSGEDVENGSQILIQFNRPVVPLGRMERDADELSITITPEVKGQWRWLNPTDLALHIDATPGITPATLYKVTVNPGIMTQDGVTLAKPVVHTFITRRPAISYYEFLTWRSPGMPVIALHFNQPVTRESLIQQLLFSLASDPSYRNPVQIENQQKSTTVTEGGRDSDRGGSDGKYRAAATTWVVSPADQLPPESTVNLIANPGVTSALGAEKSVETREVVQFDTFPDFKFAGLRCYTISGKEPITISPEEASSGDLQHIVDPRGYSELLFTAPVAFEQIRDNVLFLPDLAMGQKNYDPWANAYNSYGLNFPHTRGALYGVAIPQYLKAWQQYTVVEKRPGISDQFGRQLISPIDFTFYTDHRKPGYQIIHETGVLEKDLDSEVPVALTNIDEMTISYTTFSRENEDNLSNQNQSARQNGATRRTGKDIVNSDKRVVKSNLRVQDIAYFSPLGVREMLNNSSGAVYGKVISTSPAVDKSERESNFFTVVTPWQIHAKVGHFNSLVWVTSLVTGEPVSDVTVTVHRDLLENLTRNAPAIAQAVTDGNGIAMLPGMVVLDPARETFKDSWEYGLPRLIIKAAQNSDAALLPLTYNHDFSLPLWRVSDGNVSSQTEPQYAHIHAWGTTPQGIYKAGDTVEYKIYVRDQSNRSFTTPPPSGYRLTITDPSGKNVFEKKEITLSQFNAFDGQYRVPENGAIGWYRFYLSSTFSEKEWAPLKVLVTDFTPSPFKVSTELNGEQFKPGDTLNIESAATLHAGGPYADAKVRVTVRLKEELFHTDNPVAKDFIFYKSAGGGDWEPAVPGENGTSGGSPATDGVSASDQSSGSDGRAASEALASEDQISEESRSDSTDDVESPSDLPETLLEKSATLDNMGIIRNSLKLPQSTTGYGKLEVESAVQDDRGRHVSNMKSARYFGRTLFVGVRTPQWIYEAGKSSMMQAIVVDGDGKAVDGIEISLGVQRRVTKASRIRGAGNSYLTQYINEWVTAEQRVLKSSSEPVEFEFNPSEPGDYRIIARINQGDTPHTASIYTWVTGSGQVLWQAPDDYSLAIIPESSRFKVGERAKYLVKNPFPGAWALISVERYGVLRQRVERLENSSQVIEIPVEKGDVPGFFLSVTIISPRVEKPITEGGVDLGKPTFRMGYVETRVTEVGHDINVKVMPERAIYKPGERVKVSLHADREKNMTSEEKEKPDQRAESRSDEKIELAIAVLDEAVFDLIASGRDHFDIYKGFHTLDGLDLENYSLLTNMIGRRKFEKKGANVGGDGGAGMKMRSFFKYVSYWNPSLVTDASGNANIEFTAPDNLTGWKIFVMAATPTDAMGMAEGDFKVNRPTEIRPVMPNQVTAGDSFQAGFSVMNRSDKQRTIHVSVKMKSAVTQGEKSGETEEENSSVKQNRDAAKAESVITEDIELLPFKRKTVLLPVETKAAGTLTFTAEAEDQLDGDAITHTLKVNRERALVTVLNYGIMTSAKSTDEEQQSADGADQKSVTGAEQERTTDADPKSVTDAEKKRTTDAEERSVADSDQKRAVEHLLYPSNIYTDSGNTKVTLYPTVLGNMDEAFRYMESYPYGCWEQKLSKAVMASHFMELKGYLPATSAWNGADELPETTLKQAAEFQAPNGGMAYFTPENNYVCPYLSAYTALAFGWLKARGFEPPHDVEIKLLDYLATLLRKDIFPGSDNNGFYSAGMASTVRAVALDALAGAGKATLNDITRYKPHLREMSLFGRAHLLMASLKVKGAEEVAADLWEVLLSSGHQSAGKVVFSEILDTGFSRILESSLRTQGAILSAIVQYGQRASEKGKENGGTSIIAKSDSSVKPAIKDESEAEDARELAFKLVRTITETRGRDNSGENTQENIFCMNGLADYSAAYEMVGKRPGRGKEGNSIYTVEARAILNHEVSGEEQMGSASFRDLKDAPVTLIRDITTTDPGKRAEIVINSSGTGTLYYSAGMSYAPKDDFTQPINSGMEIKREYSVERDGKWELLKGKDQVERVINIGDLVRVDIFLSLPTARNFPVISDPVPGGFEPVNRELATASVIDAQKADSPLPEGSWWFRLKDWHEFNGSRWGFYHQELGHSAVRYYADYLPAGNYHLSYTAQAVAMGSFKAMPTHVEEMYNADIFGKGVAEKITVANIAEP